MSRMKFDWKWSGFNEVRKSVGVTNLCRQVAETKFASISGVDGYTLEPRNYPDRNGFAISATDFPAIADNKKHETLRNLVK